MHPDEYRALDADRINREIKSGSLRVFTAEDGENSFVSEIRVSQTKTPDGCEMYDLVVNWEVPILTNDATPVPYFPPRFERQQEVRTMTSYAFMRSFRLFSKIELN